MLHGTADDVCPLRWSRETDRLLREASVDSSLEILNGEGHVFYKMWPKSMASMLTFLDREMRRPPSAR